MRRTILGFGFLLGVNSVWASDSHIYGLPYAELIQEIKVYSKLFPNAVEAVEYGQSVGGRPLFLVKIARKDRSHEKKNALLISGATHGYEYLHIADRLIFSFLKQIESEQERGVSRFVDNGGVLYIVPIFNPDGYEARQRRNLNDMDLNRDFPLFRENHEGFSQPETRQFSEYLIREILSQRLNLKITMDYHCCKGALIHPWSYVTAPIDAPDLKRHQEFGVVMQSIFGDHYLVGSTPDVLGGNRIGTSKDFYFETFGAVSFTFEGKRELEEEKFPLHVELWDSYLRRLE